MSRGGGSRGLDGRDVLTSWWRGEGALRQLRRVLTPRAVDLAIAVNPKAAFDAALIIHGLATEVAERAKQASDVAREAAIRHASETRT